MEGERDRYSQKGWCVWFCCDHPKRSPSKASETRAISISLHSSALPSAWLPNRTALWTWICSFSKARIYLIYDITDLIWDLSHWWYPLMLANGDFGTYSFCLLIGWIRSIPTLNCLISAVQREFSCIKLGYAKVLAFRKECSVGTLNGQVKSHLFGPNPVSTSVSWSSIRASTES